MGDGGSDFRRSLIKEILRDDVRYIRREITMERVSKKVSIVHLPSSTFQLWRKAYMWVKSISLLMLLLGGIGFIWSAEEILTGSLLGAVGFITMTAGAAAITYVIDLGERELGLWRYENVGRFGLFPKFQWRFIS